MILKGLNGSFSGIGAVRVGRYNMESDTLLAHEGFEVFWALVVQHLKGWVETALGQLGVPSRVCTDEFVFAP